MKKIRLVWGIVVSLFVFGQCSNPEEAPLYQQTATIGNYWPADSVIDFSFTIDNHIVPYDIGLQIQHRPTYWFRNIYFFITTVYPSGHMKTDTANAVLADSKGFWFGKKSGDDYTLTLLYRHHILLPESGTYHIRIEQAMRDTLLTGIKSIGIEVRKAVLSKN